jgi:hypothetical protein
MFARNVSVHLKSNMLSDDIRTFAKDILPSLRKQNGMRKLIVGGMLLGLLTGVCFAQRAAPSARPAPSASPVAPSASPIPSASPAVPSASPVTPSANPVTPNVNTVDPNANTVDPNVNTVAPGTNTVGPTDMTQKPPIPPNTVVSPDAAPPIPQH